MKGQNLRIFLGTSSSNACIASAQDCTFHVSASTEDVSTKDSAGDWSESDVVGKSWDVSANALFVATDPVSGGTAKTGTDLLGMIGTQVYVVFDATQSSGNNRTAVTPAVGFKRSGNAIVTDVSISAANRKNGTISIKLDGTGALS